MVQKKNSVLRILVPLVVSLAGLGIVAAVITNTGKRPSSPQPQPQAQPQSQPQVQQPADPAADTPASGVQPPQPDLPLAELTGLHAQSAPAEDSFAAIGSADPLTDDRLELIFSPENTGLRALNLAQYRTDYKPTAPPVTLQREFEFVQWSGTSRSYQVQGLASPFGAVAAVVNGSFVVLTGRSSPVWRQTAPGSFQAVIVDEQDTPILRITRTYRLTPGSYDVTIEQAFANLTDAPIEIVWYQYAQADLPIESTGYAGERRRFRFGYMWRKDLDPFDTILSKDYLWSRDKVLKMGKSRGDPGPPTSTPIWPNSKSDDAGYRLVWSGMTNRYFGVAVHPAPSRDPLDRQLAVPKIERQLLEVLPAVQSQPGSQPPDPDKVLALLLQFEPLTLQPGQVGSLDVSFYAGPLSPKVMRADANADELKALGIKGMILYSFGGPCAPCTFSWLTAWLFALLNFLHDHVLFDWALSIIALVVIVRTILHPVTKWSQIRIQRFSKQMQGMAPKTKKIQEKYAHDKKRMQQEMGKLWREEGINPAGALGCLPMFLQTPIWIALYAMLYFTIELRHNGAFFGVFQTISGGAWPFLADLSAADRVIPLPVSFKIPLMGTIDAFNILPIALGVVFYIHQKYMTPPSTTMTPEQQSQQKMMKIMMVVMFPVIMYNAPSGLAIYFIANSTIAIFESRYIRAHMDKHDLLNVEKKPRKEGGFMHRLQQVAEQRRQMLEQRQLAGKGKRKAAPRAKGPGKQLPKARKEQFERRYKKKK